jgi:dihydroxyacetone kinase
MTRIFNDPNAFTEDMLTGFLDAHAHIVMGVPGGVVRAHETPTGKVAVVVGGGSGHYPAFCGVVGEGFADGAVVGNIFTSPSAEQAYRVSRAVASDAGVLLTSGNYAGDVMHFTEAARRLTAEGVPARVLFVTDDVASAPIEQVERRRGVAGDFVVFRIAGAAAERGDDLSAVYELAARANSRTRTLGVAFSGCTLPGEPNPLFSVPRERMAVGLGIHGEPGVSEAVLPTADELAAQLVDGTTAELDPAWGTRITAVLNGLGSTKYEELFLLWGRVAALLRDRGYTLVEPEVGELVTSLDMAGVSLTLTALDADLEHLWASPTHTPAYRKSGVAPRSRTAATRRVRTGDLERDSAQLPQGSIASRNLAGHLLDGFVRLAEALADHREELGRIDGVAGDGDHGRGMVKGITAALDAARRARQAGAGAATLLDAAGKAWAAQAGGTSGALWGAGLRAAGTMLDDDAAAFDAGDAVSAVTAAINAIRDLGKAELGDKTMLDAGVPFLRALTDSVASGETLPAAWHRAAAAATEAADATAALRPRVGRARPLAERSIGTPDAGAVSLALCARAAIPSKATATSPVRGDRGALL